MTLGGFPGYTPVFMVEVESEGWEAGCVGKYLKLCSPWKTLSPLQPHTMATQYVGEICFKHIELTSSL